MNCRLLEIMNGCRADALALADNVSAIDSDSDIPEEIQDALSRIASAISLDIKLDKCEAFLSEDSADEITDAYFKAQDAISSVLNNSLAAVDEYMRTDKDFAERVDLLSVHTPSSGVTDDLLKLYKCESIIRMAYESAQKFPIYGGAYMRDGIADEVVTDQDWYIKCKMGVDLSALREIRENLAKEMKRKIAEKK
jgi:hypothetical protein